jgi:hypothetical protein
MPILPLLKIAGFDATETSASTFDIAWDVLQRSGSTLAADDNDIVAVECSSSAQREGGNVERESE